MEGSIDADGSAAVTVILTHGYTHQDIPKPGSWCNYGTTSSGSLVSADRRAPSDSTTHDALTARHHRRDYTCRVHGPAVLQLPVRPH